MEVERLSKMPKIKLILDGPIFHFEMTMEGTTGMSMVLSKWVRSINSLMHSHVDNTYSLSCRLKMQRPEKTGLSILSVSHPSSSDVNIETNDSRWPFFLVSAIKSATIPSTKEEG